MQFSIKQTSFLVLVALTASPFFPSHSNDGEMSSFAEAAPVPGIVDALKRVPKLFEPITKTVKAHPKYTLAGVGTVLGGSLLLNEATQTSKTIGSPSTGQIAVGTSPSTGSQANSGQIQQTTDASGQQVLIGNTAASTSSQASMSADTATTVDASQPMQQQIVPDTTDASAPVMLNGDTSYTVGAAAQ